MNIIIAILLIIISYLVKLVSVKRNYNKVISNMSYISIIAFAMYLMLK